MPEEQYKRPVSLNYASPDAQARSQFRKRFWTVLGFSCMGVALVVSLMPLSTHHGRAGYARTKCTSNLHQIGLGIMLYANENNGVFPDSFQSMALAENLPAAVFVCPASSDEASTAPTTQGQIDDLATPGHLSYIYLGQGLTNQSVLPNQIVAYEPLRNHGDGINVLLGDGHAEFIDKTRATKVIADSAAGKKPVILPP